jgi:glucose-fructose oxidoreductase
MQTHRKPEGEEILVDELKAPFQNPVQYVVHCIRHHHAPEGPLSPRISRIGQQIVDSAILSASRRKTVHLVS